MAKNKKRKNFLEGFGDEPIRNTTGQQNVLHIENDDFWRSHPEDPSEDDELDPDQLMNEIKHSPMFDILMSALPEKRRQDFMLMLELWIRGISPEEYSNFDKMICHTKRGAS